VNKDLPIWGGWEGQISNQKGILADASESENLNLIVRNAPGWRLGGILLNSF
jgi:hypothetical protein